MKSVIVIFLLYDNYTKTKKVRISKLVIYFTNMNTINQCIEENVHMKTKRRKENANSDTTQQKNRPRM